MYLALRDSGYYFHYGVYNKNGEVGSCEMYKDGRLITVYAGDDEEGVPALCFLMLENSMVQFSGDTLTFGSEEPFFGRQLKEGTLLGYLRNSGTSPLTVLFTWRRVAVLQPEEEIEVRYGMGAEL